MADWKKEAKKSLERIGYYDYVRAKNDAYAEQMKKEKETAGITPASQLTPEERRARRVRARYEERRAKESDDKDAYNKYAVRKESNISGVNQKKHSDTTAQYVPGDTVKQSLWDKIVDFYGDLLPDGSNAKKSFNKATGYRYQSASYSDDIYADLAVKALHEGDDVNHKGFEVVNEAYAVLSNSPKYKNSDLVKALREAKKSWTASPFKATGSNAWAAVTGMGSDIANFTNMLGADKIPGVKDINDFVIEYADKQAENASKYNKGTLGEARGGLTQGVVNLIPYIAIGMASGGSSVAASSTNALSASKYAPILKQIASNPSFWYSLMSSAGDKYDEASKKGADRKTATLNAVAYALPAALIEQSSGFGSTKKDPLWQEVGGEVLEELSQNVVSGLADKITTNPELPFYSHKKGEEAVVNPTEMAETAAMTVPITLIGGGMSNVAGKTAVLAEQKYQMHKANTDKKVMDTALSFANSLYEDYEGSVDNSMTKSEINRLGKIYKEDSRSLKDLVNEGLESPTDTTSYKIANSINEKMEKNKKLSNNEVGQLVEATIKQTIAETSIQSTLSPEVKHRVVLNRDSINNARVKADKGSMSEAKYNENIIRETEKGINSLNDIIDSRISRALGKEGINPETRKETQAITSDIATSDDGVADIETLRSYARAYVNTLKTTNEKVFKDLDSRTDNIAEAIIEAVVGGNSAHITETLRSNPTFDRAVNNFKKTISGILSAKDSFRSKYGFVVTPEAVAQTEAAKNGDFSSFMATNNTTTPSVETTAETGKNKATNDVVVDGAITFVQDILGADTLSSNQVDRIISTPTLNDAFTRLSGVKIQGTKTEQRAIVRNWYNDYKSKQATTDSVSPEIKPIVDAMTETFKEGAVEDIYEKMEKNGLKGDIGVFAERIRNFYYKNNSLGDFAGYFVDDGKKVAAVMDEQRTDIDDIVDVVEETVEKPTKVEEPTVAVAKNATTNTNTSVEIAPMVENTEKTATVEDQATREKTQNIVAEKDVEENQPINEYSISEDEEIGTQPTIKQNEYGYELSGLPSDAELVSIANDVVDGAVVTLKGNDNINDATLIYEDNVNAEKVIADIKAYYNDNIIPDNAFNDDLPWDDVKFSAIGTEKPTPETSNDEKFSLSSMGFAFFGDEKITADEFEKMLNDGSYKKKQGYIDYVNKCVDVYKQSRGIKSDLSKKQVAQIENNIEGIMRVAIAAKRAGYDVFDDGHTRDIADSKNRLLFSSLEPNSDYFTSSDISTICDKAKNFTEIYDEINRREEEMGVPVDEKFFSDIDNYFALHQILAEKGLTVPCHECYVQSMRKNLVPMAKAFIELVTETDPTNTENAQLYHQEGKNKGTIKKNNAKVMNRVRKAFEKIEATNTQKDKLNGLDDNTLVELGVAVNNEINDENSIISVNDLTVEMLTSAKGLAQLKMQAPTVYEAFNSFYGQSKPKMPKEAVPFRPGELIALLTKDDGSIDNNLVKRIKATGGLRLQSYSDFQIENYVDVLQTIFEASMLGLNGHAYTKVPAFLDATDGTNLKRNVSIFMYNDDGKWAIDKSNSFPMELEDIYALVASDESGNTSIIAVSQNADMSAWIMANDFIGYGIPFHKSGVRMDVVRGRVVKTEDGRKVFGYSEMIDHTKQQSEVYKKTVGKNKADNKVKKPINIYSIWDFENKEKLSGKKLIEKNVKRYIDECEKKNYRPKFREYLMDNEDVLNNILAYAKQFGFVSQDATIDDISFKHGEYTIPYGYYKFLGDFGMFKPDGTASPIEVLSLDKYDFDKAVAFFENAETLRANELLQQFENGKVRENYRKMIDSGELTTEQLKDIIKAKRTEVVEDIFSKDQKYSESEENNNEQRRDDILSGDVAGRFGESAGEQGRSIYERPRVAEENGKRGQSTPRSRKLYGKTVRKNNGTEVKRVGLLRCEFVKEDFYNDEMKRIADENSKKGITTYFFVGDGKHILKKALSFRGAVRGDEIFIQCDNAKYSAEQINKHEIVHREYKSEAIQKIKAYIESKLTKEEKKNISEKLYANYRSVTNGNVDAIFEEFVCDVMAGMNDYSVRFENVANEYWSNQESDIDIYSPAEYTESIDAGGNGDMETTQRMVDEGKLTNGQLEDLLRKTRSEVAREVVDGKRFSVAEDSDGNALTEEQNNTDIKVVDLSMENELTEKVKGLKGAEKYKAIRDYILDVLDDIIVFNDGIRAKVDRSDALHIANRSADKKTAYISKIKELINSAKLYAVANNIEHDKFNAFRYYQAVVRLEDEVYPIYLNVGHAKNGDGYHLYDITKKVGAIAKHENVLERVKDLRSKIDTPTFEDNIPQKPKSVKRKYFLKDEINSLPEEDKEIVLEARHRAIYSRSIATMTEDRLSKAYNDYSHKNPSTTSGYLAYIEPLDFISLTTTSVDKFLEQNPQRLNEGVSKDWGTKNDIQNSGELYLKIDDDGNVVGHEGRHRMAGLYREGVDKVAVVIKTNQVDDAKPISIKKLSGQNFGDAKSYSSVYVHNMLPISKEYENINKHIFGDVTEGSRFVEPNIRYSVAETDYAPTFYSHMGKTIDEMKQDKIGANSVVSYLKGRGVKDEEIKWSGIETFLDGKKSVTKTELQEFVASNQLEIEETTLDKNEIPYTQEQTEEIDFWTNKMENDHKVISELWKEAFNEDLPEYHNIMAEGDNVLTLLQDKAYSARESTPEGKAYRKATAEIKEMITRNDDFGFDNFREAFATIVRNPKDFAELWDMDDADREIARRYTKAQEAFRAIDLDSLKPENATLIQAYADRMKASAKKINDVRSKHYSENEKHMAKWGEYTLKGGENYREILFKMPNSNFTNVAMEAHWSNNAKGILAHARIQDFDVDGEKMLFIEEIQSDWHNEGHKAGYSSKNPVYEVRLEDHPFSKENDGTPKKVYRLYKDGQSTYQFMWEESAKDFDDEADKWVTAPESEILEQLIDYDIADSATVPDAPYRNNYHEYVLKRLIRMAAEEGYDMIGWTPSEIQSERWSEDYAEGYRIEYDQDIPKFLNKYGKKWGAKVGTTTLGGSSVTEYTISLEEGEVGNGTVYQSKKEAIAGLVEYVNDTWGTDYDIDNAIVASSFDDGLVIEDEVSGDEIGFINVEEASGAKVWSMPITDSMRESVLYEGQTRYSFSNDDTNFLSKPIKKIKRNINEIRLKAEMKKGKVYSQSDVREVASAMLNNIKIGKNEGLVMSKGDKAAMAVLVNRVLNESNGTSPTAIEKQEENIKRLSAFIAQKAKVFDSLDTYDYKGELKELKNNVIHSIALTNSDKETLDSIGASGYKAVFGGGKDGVDVIYSNLSSQNPDQFPMDTNATDIKLKRIVEMYNWLKEGVQISEERLIDILSEDEKRDFVELVHNEVKKALGNETLGRDSKTDAIKKRLGKKIEAREKQILDRRVRDILITMKKNVKKDEKKGGYPKEVANIAQDAIIGLNSPDGIDLSTFKMAYDTLKDSGDYSLSSEYSEDLSDMIGRLHQEIKGKKFNSLNSTELSMVKDVLSELRHRLYSARKQIGIAKAKENAEIASQIINDIKKNSSRNQDVRKQILKEIKFGNNAIKAFLFNPTRINEIISGYNENSEWAKLFDQLRRGSRKADKFLMDATKPFDTLTSGAKNEIEYYDFRTELFDTGIKYIDGTEVKIPKSIICELVMAWDRKEGRQHLEVGGATIPDVKKYNQGKTYQSIHDYGKRTRAITQNDIDRLKNMLDKYDQEWIKKARHLFDNVTKGAINETSMQLLGRELANVPNYIRLYVDEDLRNREIRQKYNPTLEGHGSLKETVEGAVQPIVLRGLQENVYDQIDFVSKYYGLAIPIRNFNKVYNSKLGIGDNILTVSDVLSKEFGSDFRNGVIEQMIVDLQSPRFEENNIILKGWNKVRMNWLNATFFANLKSTLKQTTSYWTAASILDEDSLVKGMSKYLIHAKKTKAEIEKYSGTLYKRSQGLSTTELGDRANAKRLAGASKGVTRFINKHLPILRKIPEGLRPQNWLQAMDVNTSAALWEACKADVAKRMEPESQGYMKAVADLYEKVIEETQSNYDILHRPEALKTTNPVVKTFMMFQNDNLQQTGLIYSAYGNLKAKSAEYKQSKTAENEKSLEEAKRRFAKSIRARVYSSLYLAFMNVLGAILLRKFNPLIDDDEKEITAGSVLEYAMEQIVADMIGVFMPLFGDVILKAFDTFSKGYDFANDPSIESVQEFIEATSKIYQKVSEEDYKGAWDAVVKAIPAISNITGVPIKNITDLFKAAVGYAQDIKLGDFAHDISSYADGFTYKDLASSIVSDNKEKEEKVSKWFAEEKGLNKSSLTKAIKPAYVTACIEDEKQAKKIKNRLVLEYDYDEDTVDNWLIAEYMDNAIQGKTKSDGSVSDTEYASNIASFIKKSKEWNSDNKAIKSGFKSMYKECSESERKELQKALAKSGIKASDIKKWAEEAEDDMKAEKEKAEKKKEDFKKNK